MINEFELSLVEVFKSFLWLVTRELVMGCYQGLSGWRGLNVFILGITQLG